MKELHNKELRYNGAMSISSAPSPGRVVLTIGDKKIGSARIVNIGEHKVEPNDVRLLRRETTLVLTDSVYGDDIIIDALRGSFTGRRGGLYCKVTRVYRVVTDMFMVIADVYSDS